jgi:hypothetical protein
MAVAPILCDAMLFGVSCGEMVQVSRPPSVRRDGDLAVSQRVKLVRPVFVLAWILLITSHNDLNGR